MSDQSVALRLADWLEATSDDVRDECIFIELRRQHAEIGRLTELHTLYQDKTTQLKTERDELKAEVERMKGVTRSGSGTATYTGCLACGIGADGKAYGYVCPRQDCPIRISYGVTHE
jgi:hypothetical protein